MPKITPIISLMLVVVLLAITAAPVISADSTQVYFDSVNINIESANASIYDEIVNLADPTLTNVDTWSPEPEGVFIGGQTQESRFQYQINQTTYNIRTHVEFSSAQIMDGSSLVVIRSPWAVSAEIKEHYLTITNGTNLIFEIRANPGTTTADSYYEVNGRAYFVVRGFIFPDVNYTIDFKIYQGGPSSAIHPYFYLSPNDVANDNRTNTTLTAGGETDYLNCDPGVSYDFRRGAGGGIAGVSITMYAGEMLAWREEKNPYSGNSRLQFILPLNNADAYNFDIYVQAVGLDEYGELFNTNRITEAGNTYYNGIYAGSSYGLFGGTFNNANDLFYLVFLVARENLTLDITMRPNAGTGSGKTVFLMSGEFGPSSYTNDIVGAVASLYIKSVYTMRMTPIATLTPTSNTWAGPGTADTWTVIETPTMGSSSLLSYLTIAILDAALMPVNWIFEATVGTSLTTIIYENYLAGTIAATDNYIQNGIDRVIDSARDIVQLIYGIGEEILTVLTIALSVIADAIGALAGLIALLVIQGIFFWILTSIIRLGESIISSARGDSERARKILDKEGVA